MYFYLPSPPQMIFFFLLIFSTLISISSNSWLGCWIGLEINLLSFIPLISNPNNLMSTEASLKYFLTQSIASINFMYSILLKMIFFMNLEMNLFLSIMINSSMLMKMGSVPFHFWFPNMVEGLSWINNFILMTWQKITPMIILSYYMNKNFIYIIIIMNVIIGAIGGLNQISLRKLMTFSSINNMGWMMSNLMISENLWMLFLMIYSFMISIIYFMFHMMNMFFINQLFINNFNPMIKINMMINFLSLGGLPPFIGFLPKWIIINYLINNNLFLLVFILIMTSLIVLFYYIRIMYSIFMFNYIKFKWIKMIYKNNNFMFINFMSFFSIFGMIFSTFYFF